MSSFILSFLPLDGWRREGEGKGKGVEKAKLLVEDDNEEREN